MSNASFRQYGIFYNQISPDLQKGGPGSGVRGHTTARKPFPGEEAHKAPRLPQPHELTYKPESLMPHYSDTENHAKFKKLHRKYGSEIQGKIAYHKKSDSIVVLDHKWVGDKTAKPEAN